MSIIKVEAKFEPAALRANRRNESVMNLSVSIEDNPKDYWCQCEILLNPPLSLAPDKELKAGRIMMGILRPGRKIVKPVKLYTRPNNFPDSYPIGITAYLYDEDGAIAERVELNESILCDVDGQELQNKQG